ncbi:MAG: hypothetical protein GX282_03075 [Campylobacteraceae bacterium]|nr:hypothetical protein [Campylobacteraceae bacterium]
MKKQILFTFTAALLLSGCLAKKSEPYNYYEMTYKGESCEVRSPKAQKIYVSNIQALNLADNRDILIVDSRNNIRYVNDAKYVTLPSEMVYKGIVSAVASECEFEQIFRPNTKDYVLNTSLLSLQVNHDQAEVILGYDLMKGGSSVKSGVIKNHVFVPDPSTPTILKHMDISVNQAIDRLMNEIKQQVRK